MTNLLTGSIKIHGLPTVNEIRTTDGFTALESEWNTLLRGSSSDCLFLSWEWLHTWWRHLAEDRRLSILTVRSEGELIGVAPLARCPWNLRARRPFSRLEFLGSGYAGSDYLDVIAQSGRESLVRRALALHIAARRSALKWTQLRRGNCFAAQIASELGRMGWSTAEAPTNVCPYILLGGETWESYLSTLGGSHRYTFQRKVRRLERDFEVNLSEVTTPEDCRTALDALIDLHNHRWAERGGSDAFHEGNLVSFHRDFAQAALQRGWLRLYVMRLNGRVVACLYGYRYGKTFYFYQSGFDEGVKEYGVGVVLMGIAIQRAIQEQAEEFDMLHGNETYKSHWCRQSRELSRLELYPPGGRGWLCMTSMALARSSRQFGRREPVDGLA